MKTHIIILIILIALSSCSSWTSVEPILINDDRNHGVTENAGSDAYAASLRAWKTGKHYLTYVRMGNSPDDASSEKDYMRCLPDSLDIISLTNAANFSDSDREDLKHMHRMGTKVLYQLDFDSLMDSFPDASSLGAWVDKAVSVVAAEGLDGWSFTGTPLYTDLFRAEASALIMDRLQAARTAGQLIVFEGNPLFVSEEDRQEVDYFVLATDLVLNIADVKAALATSTGYAAVPATKILLAARISAEIMNENKQTVNAVDELTSRVIPLGPLAGMAVYNIEDDYYDAYGNYPQIRRTIQTLNPAK